MFLSLRIIWKMNLFALARSKWYSKIYGIYSNFKLQKKILFSLKIIHNFNQKYILIEVPFCKNKFLPSLVFEYASVLSIFPELKVSGVG